MKGFAITLVTISLIMILVMLASSLHDGRLSMERIFSEPQTLISGSFIIKSISHDVNSICGPNITITQLNNSVSILFVDIIPNNGPTALSAYEDFIETTLANKTHSIIDANFSDINSSTIQLTINGDYFYIRDYNNSDLLFTADGQTSANAYYINISVSRTRESITSFTYDDDGDLNVTLRYMDNNGTESSDGKVFSSGITRFSALYDDGSYIYVDIGLKNGNDGSLWIKSYNCTAIASWVVELPAIEYNNELGYTYNASIYYEHGNTLISRQIG